MPFGLRATSQNYGRKKYACTYGQIVFASLFVCICVLSKCAYLSIIVLIIPGMISSVSSVSQMTGAVQCVNIRVPASVLRATQSRLSLSPMSNYEHDINVIKKPSSDLTSTLGSIYFLYLSLGSYPASQI